MKYRYCFYTILCIVLIGVALFVYNKVYMGNSEHKVVVCVPVYGQSLALGEEAIRITDFDSLDMRYDGRIVTEKLDHTFGYFDHSSQLKQWVKRLLHYDKKAFELSVYSMAEELATKLGEDTLICIFPGGHGMNTIKELMKPALPYQKFLQEITTAYEKSKARGWEFYVPAVCWMQGESDIVEYPNYDYKTFFHKMYRDMNDDIKKITHQKEDVRMICYQTTALTKGRHYRINNYNATEPRVPMVQMELVRDDTLIWASGPTYFCDFVGERLHIDAYGQQQIGKLAARSALGIIRGGKKELGLVPLSYDVHGHDVYIHFNVPCQPLCFDTINVKKSDNYGFNVIRNDDADILAAVHIDGDDIVLKCKESPVNCKIRYGVNGDVLKGGRWHGARGNLRDSQRGVSNWCYIFDFLIVYDEGICGS